MQLFVAQEFSLPAGYSNQLVRAVESSTEARQGEAQIVFPFTAGSIISSLLCDRSSGGFRCSNARARTLPFALRRPLWFILSARPEVVPWPPWSV